MSRCCAACGAPWSEEQQDETGHELCDTCFRNSAEARRDAAREAARYGICLNCDERFEKNVNGANKTFCGHCHKERDCAGCGKPMGLTWPNHRFCSNTCLMRFLRWHLEDDDAYVPTIAPQPEPPLPDPIVVHHPDEITYKPKPAPRIDISRWQFKEKH